MAVRRYACGMKLCPASTISEPPNLETKSLKNRRTAAGVKYFGSTSPMMMRSYLNKFASLVSGIFGEVGRTLRLDDGRVAFQQHAFEVDARVAQQDRLQVAELPARRLLDEEHLDLAVDDAQFLRRRVVFLHGLVVARVDERLQLELARLRRLEHERDRLLALVET